MRWYRPFRQRYRHTAVSNGLKLYSFNGSQKQDGVPAQLQVFVAGPLGAPLTPIDSLWVAAGDAALIFSSNSFKISERFRAS